MKELWTQKDAVKLIPPSWCQNSLQWLINKWYEDILNVKNGKWIKSDKTVCKSNRLALTEEEIHRLQGRHSILIFHADENIWKSARQTRNVRGAKSEPIKVSSLFLLLLSSSFYLCFAFRNSDSLECMYISILRRWRRHRRKNDRQKKIYIYI